MNLDDILKNKNCSRRDVLKALRDYGTGITVASLPLITGCSAEPTPGPRYLIGSSGHGGLEIGAHTGGYDGGMIDAFLKSLTRARCEDEITYDTLCWLKSLDKKNDDFGVIPIIMDGSTGYTPQKNLSGFPNKNEYIVYRDEKGRLQKWRMKKKGFNIPMKVKVINLLFDRMVNDGVDPNNIYQVELHGDSAPKGSFGPFAIYPNLDYGFSVNYKSRDFADKIHESFKKLGLRPMNSYSRGNLGIFKTKVHKKVDIEMGNLFNEKDQDRMNKYTYRRDIGLGVKNAVMDGYNKEVKT